MTEHNHERSTLCTSNCPRFDNLRVSKEELVEARRIADMTVYELLGEMTPKQTDALRASIIGALDGSNEVRTERNGTRTIDGSDWDEEPVPQVDSRVTRWLHEFGEAEFRRGKAEGRREVQEPLRKRVDRLRQSNRDLRQRIAGMRELYDSDRKEWECDLAELHKLQNLAHRNENAANDRDEYASRLQVIAELCNRDITDPIGDRVEDLAVFAQRMRRFAKEYIVREGLVGPNPDKMADALIQYVTGRKPGDAVAR